MGKPKNNKKTSCKICDSEEALSGTKLCDRCWEMERTIDSFILENTSAALDFLLDKAIVCNRKKKRAEIIEKIKG